MRSLAAFAFLALAQMAAVRTVGPQPAGALRALGIPAGEWKGQVRYTATTPVEVYFWSTEVQYRLGGEVLSIEGKGGPATDTSRITRRVLAQIWQDVSTGEFLGSFQWLADGGVGTSAASVRRAGDTVVLVVKASDAVQRFTINLKDPTRWLELGEFSLDGGTTWKPFFEMTLSRRLN